MWLDYDFVLLGGGSLLRPLELCQMKAALQAGKTIATCGTGYEDLMHQLPPTAATQLRLGQITRPIEELLGKEQIPFFLPIDKRYLHHGGWRGNMTATIARALGGGNLPVIGDPGLLYGAKTLFGDVWGGAAWEAEQIFSDIKLDHSLPLIMVSILLPASDHGKYTAPCL